MLPAAIHIRKACLSDAPLLPAIERSAAQRFLDIPALAWIANSTVMTTAQHRDAIRNGLEWIANNAGKPAGFLMAKGYDHDLYIAELAVARTLQRRGIGRALVAAAQACATEKKLHRLTLTTFHDVPWNAPFYKSLGFRIMPDPPPYLCRILEDEEKRGLKRNTRVVMALSLTSPPS